jgi:hypothetical protein
VTLLLVGLCVFGGPVALAWLDARLIDRRASWAVWAITIVWLMLWEALWILSLHDRDVWPVFHTVRQLFAYVSYVDVFLPVSLAFGFPAVTVACIAVDRDENGRRSSVRRSVAYGVVMAIVMAPMSL